MRNAEKNKALFPLSHYWAILQLCKKKLSSKRRAFFLLFFHYHSSFEAPPSSIGSPSGSILPSPGDTAINEDNSISSISITGLLYSFFIILFFYNKFRRTSLRNLIFLQNQLLQNFLTVDDVNTLIQRLHVVIHLLTIDRVNIATI